MSLLFGDAKLEPGLLSLSSCLWLIVLILFSLFQTFVMFSAYKNIVLIIIAFSQKSNPFYKWYPGTLLKPLKDTN